MLDLHLTSRARLLRLASGQCGLVSGCDGSQIPCCMSEPDRDDGTLWKICFTPGHCPLTCRGLLRPNHAAQYVVTACHRGNIFFTCCKTWYLDVLVALVITKPALALGLFVFWMSFQSCENTVSRLLVTLSSRSLQFVYLNIYIRSPLLPV